MVKSIVMSSWLLLPLLGCALSANDASEPVPARAKMTPLPPRPTPQILGTSVQGRAIEVFTYGSGGQSGRPVLVIGAIHGSEPTTAVVAQRLGEYLHLNPRLTANVAVAIIPVANPDGLQILSRTNANKV